MSSAPDKSPEAYAKHLAGYIRDPSTIRARTMEQFGRAPTLNRIVYWRSEAERIRSKPPQVVGEPIAPPELNLREPRPRDDLVFDTPPWRPGGYLADEIISEIARSFGLTLAEIRGPSRKTYVVRIRMLVAGLLAKRGNTSGQIGKWINREHSTVLHGIHTLPDLIERHPPIAKAYAHFLAQWGIKE